MPIYQVRAASLAGTYTAGRYYAEDPYQAVEEAREDYENTRAAWQPTAGEHRWWAELCKTAEEETD